MGNVTREEEEEEVEEENKTEKHRQPCEAVNIRRMTNGKTTLGLFAFLRSLPLAGQKCKVWFEKAGKRKAVLLPKSKGYPLYGRHILDRVIPTLISPKTSSSHHSLVISTVNSCATKIGTAVARGEGGCISR